MSAGPSHGPLFSMDVESLVDDSKWEALMNASKLSSGPPASSSPPVPSLPMTLDDRMEAAERAAAAFGGKQRAPHRPALHIHPRVYRAATLGALPVGHPRPLARGLAGVVQSPLQTQESTRRFDLEPKQTPLFAHLAFGVLLARFESTLEVAASKIFFAGAGWQLFAVWASEMGIDSTSVAFYGMTGAGDALGVFCGHLLFRICSKFIFRNVSVDLRSEALTALWLGSAAVCSGFAWQYVVNVSAASQGFVLVLLWTGVVCTLCFFTGLRLGRTLYAPLGMERPFYDNFVSDRLLAIAVGAGAALFVATDPGYTGHAFTWLAIHEGDSNALGIVKAGSSTFVGFSIMQTIENLLLPIGSNWLDAPPEDPVDDSEPPSMRGANRDML